MIDTTPFTIAEQFSTPNGHKYFLAGDGPHQGRWAIADGSSRMPWTTDNGVLLVNQDLPIEMGGTHIALSLEGPDGATRTIISPAEALIVGVRLGVALTHDGKPFFISDKPPAPAVRLPGRSLARLEYAIESMEKMDHVPMRARDSRVYAAGYAIVGTFGLMLGADPEDPDAVRAAVIAAIDPAIEAAEYLN